MITHAHLFIALISKHAQKRPWVHQETGFARARNVPILGDWFVADSMVPKPGGYRQTVFNWHAPTVCKWVKRFDDQFEGLCREEKIKPAQGRELVIAQIRRIIKGFGTELQAKKKKTAPPPGRTRFP